MACAFVSDFVNVFVGICVDDISNKFLHAMCVKWTPIHIIYRGPSDPREEREGSLISIESKRGSSGWVRESTSAPWVILVINVNISLIGLTLLPSMFQTSSTMDWHGLKDVEPLRY